MPAAIEVFRKIPEAIAGKNIPPEYRKKFDDAKIGADHSWNINAMHEVNRGFWSWHHKRGDVPSVLSRVRDWAMLPSFGSEQCCSYVYGNMNNSVYKAFYILAQVAGDDVTADFLWKHLVNENIVAGLSCGWVARRSKLGLCFPVTETGMRSYVVAHHGDVGYTDNQGRFNPAADIDHTPLESHINYELGFQAPLSTPYAGMEIALKRHFPAQSSRTLSFEQREILIGGVRDLQEPPSTDWRERLEHLAETLADGPFYERPVEVIKTTRGVGFIFNGPGSKSTCALYGKVWYENPDDNTGARRKLTWWHLDPRFDFLPIDPPKRKAGSPGGSALIRKRGPVYELLAQDRDGWHYDTAEKKKKKGPAVAILPGELIYWFKLRDGKVNLELPGGGSVPVPEPPSSGNLLARLWAWIVGLFR
jgi:hypothetical protein